jgi:phosphatidylglycerol:prolipoprotein diacylglycerol transferase
MYPILARFGPFLIYSYEVVLGLGIFVTIGLAAWLLREDPPRRNRWIDAILFGTLFAILGGRIVYVISHWSYFAEVPGDIWLVWRGGLSYHGVLVFGLLAFWLWTRWRDRAFSDYAGILALALALMSVFGWLACFLEGCAYGREATISLFTGDLPDSVGVYSVRYHSQLLGLFLSAGVFVVILALYKRLQPLVLFWLAFGMLAVSRLLVTLIRGDEMTLLRQLRLDTIADGLLVIAAIGALYFVFRSLSHRKRSPSGIS